MSTTLEIYKKEHVVRVGPMFQELRIRAKKVREQLVIAREADRRRNT